MSGGAISGRGKWTILGKVVSKTLGHGARDQVTVSKQLEAGCPDLGLKPANADPARACGTVEEELHHSTLSTLAIPPLREEWTLPLARSYS